MTAATCDSFGGGFRLTKWISNSKEVLNSVPEAERAPPMNDLNFDQNAVLTERALGVQWNVNADTFSFKIDKREKPAEEFYQLFVQFTIQWGLYLHAFCWLKQSNKSYVLRSLAGMTRFLNLCNNRMLGLATSRNLSNLR